MPLAYRVDVASLAPFVTRVESGSAEAMLRRLSAGMRNPEPVVRSVAAGVRQGIRTQFAVGGNPAWAPNKPNTIAGKGHSKPLHRAKGSGRGASGIERATKVVSSQTGTTFRIEVQTSKLGRYHHFGRGEPVGGRGWTIAAKKGKALRFAVAGSAGAVRPTRGGSQGRRTAGGRARSGRFDSKTVFVSRFWHPGYPARPFLPKMDDAFFDRVWTKPLYSFLFGGSRGTR